MGPTQRLYLNLAFTKCLQSFKQIHSSMDYPMAISIATALISSWLDVNSVLVSWTQKNTAHLQRAQHALAKVVTQKSTPLTSTNLLEQLHWLPIKWRIRFKLASSTYKAIHTSNPPYLADLLHHHKSIRFTRSSSSHLLDVQCHNLSFGSRAFRVSATQIYNSVPLHIRQAQTLTSSRHHIIFSLFNLNCLIELLSNVPWFSSEILALYKLILTYLLNTY